MEDDKKIIIKNKCIKACEVGKWKCVWGVEKKMGKQLRLLNDQNGKLIKMLKRCKLVKWWSDRSDSLATSNRAQGQNGLGQEAFVTSLMAFLAFIHNEKSSSSSGGWCFRVDSSLCIFWGIEGEESGWIWERERERVNEERGQILSVLISVEVYQCRLSFKLADRKSEGKRTDKKQRERERKMAPPAFSIERKTSDSLMSDVDECDTRGCFGKRKYIKVLWLVRFIFSLAALSRKRETFSK